MNETLTPTPSTSEFYEPKPIHPSLWVPPPAWLMFPRHSFNSICVTAIEKGAEHIIVYTTDQRKHIIKVDNLDDVWKSIRKALAHGISED